jgi:hypothetical protein
MLFEMPATVSYKHYSKNCMNSLQIFWLAYSLSEQALQASTHVHAFDNSKQQLSLALTSYFYVCGKKQ